MPSYGTATGCPTVLPPDFVPDSPAHLFVGTNHQSETEEQIHPDNQNDLISDSSVIHTNSDELELNDLCSYFCGGLIVITFLVILGSGIYYAITH